MARAGKTVEVPERQIKVHSLELIDYIYPEIRIKTHVSSGTYIRTLAEDIGEYLGTGAYCTQLRRISIADWNVNQAKLLSEMGIID